MDIYICDNNNNQNQNQMMIVIMENENEFACHSARLASTCLDWIVVASPLWPQQDISVQWQVLPSQKFILPPLSVCVSVSVCTSVRVCAAVCCCSPGNGKWKHPAQFASLGDAIEVWGWLGTKDKDPNIPRNVEHCQKNMSLMLFTRKGLGSRTTTWYEEVATATFWKYLQIYVCNFYFLPFFGLSISKDFYILN